MTIRISKEFQSDVKGGLLRSSNDYHCPICGRPIILGKNHRCPKKVLDYIEKENKKAFDDLEYGDL